MGVRFSELLLSSVVFLISASAFSPIANVSAQDIHVDFGVADADPPISGNPNDVYSDYYDFSVVEESVNNLGDKAGSPGPTSRIVNGVAITVGPGTGSGGVAWRDRPGEVNHPMGDLLEDLIFGDTSVNGLILTFSGLAEGFYSITTYHHDPQWTNIIALITVDTGQGETTVASNFPASTGWSPTTISTATFEFYANGLDDVAIRVIPFDYSAVFNGFDLTRTGASSTESTSWGAIKKEFR